MYEAERVVCHACALWTEQTGSHEIPVWQTMAEMNGRVH